MRSGSDAEVIVGLRDRHLAKEDVRHFLVVVLAGVDEDLPDWTKRMIGLIVLKSTGYGRCLDELRTSADDGENPFQIKQRELLTFNS